MAFPEVQNELEEQSRWGENRLYRAVTRLLTAARVLRDRSVEDRQRMQALEDRVTALEQRFPAP